MNVVGECKSLSERAKQMELQSTLDIVGNERDCLLKLVEELESQTHR